VVLRAINEFSPVRSRSAADDVLHQVLDRIRSGQLVEGDSLPGERTLASQLEVSRPTVRIAIARLVDAGLLRNGTGRSGSPEVVSIWIPDDLAMAHAAPPATGDDDAIFRLLEARRTVEPRVAQLAALRAGPEHFRLLQQSIDLLREHQGDHPKAAQAEVMFHRTMWRAAGNVPLERMMVGLFRDLIVVRDMTLRTPVDYAAAIEHHAATLAALRQGSPDEIEREMSRHLGYLEDIAEHVLERRAHRDRPSFLNRES